MSKSIFGTTPDGIIAGGTIEGSLQVNGSLSIGNEYSLPAISATSPNQVMSDILADGNLSWRDESTAPKGMKGAFDSATTFSHNIIVTGPSPSESAIFIVQGAGAPAEVLEVSNNAGQITNAFTDYGLYSLGVKTGSIEIGFDLLGNETTYILPLTRGITGSIMTADNAGVVTWQTRSYGSQSISNNFTETVIIQDVWTYVEGVRTAGILNDFAVFGSVIQYSGAITKTFKIEVNLSWKTVAGNTTMCAVALFVGGNIILATVQHGQLDDNNIYPRNVGTSCIVNVNPGDEVGVYVKNIEAADNILVPYLNLTMTQV
jgi:hypothetical protein